MLWSWGRATRDPCQMIMEKEAAALGIGFKFLHLRKYGAESNTRVLGQKSRQIIEFIYRQQKNVLGGNKIGSDTKRGQLFCDLVAQKLIPKLLPAPQIMVSETDDDTIKIVKIFYIGWPRLHDFMSQGINLRHTFDDAVIQMP